MAHYSTAFAIASIFLVASTPIAPAQVDIDPVVEAPPPLTCRDVIGYSLQGQGSRFFRRTQVITALSNLAIFDTITAAETSRALRTAIPNSDVRATFVPMATAAIAQGQVSGLCYADTDAVESADLPSEP